MARRTEVLVALCDMLRLELILNQYLPKNDTKSSFNRNDSQFLNKLLPEELVGF